MYIGVIIEKDFFQDELMPDNLNARWSGEYITQHLDPTFCVGFCWSFL